MTANKISPKHANLEVHSHEVALLLTAVESLDNNKITRHFAKELRKMKNTLEMLLEEME